MSTDLMASLAIIETMLKDVEQDYAADLFDHPEVHSGLQMSKRQLTRARLRIAEALEQGKQILVKPTEQQDDVRLTNSEKWLLRSMSDRKDGVSARLISAQHDRLVHERLIFESNSRFFITEKGRASLAELIKLPGSGGGLLSVQK